MRTVKEVIVVEGRYDKNALKQVVNATVLETSGFGIFNDKEKLALIRRLAETRGIIVLTDSDGAGFVIRSHLKGALSKGKVKQAYIPEIYGKERRKAHAGKEGLLGVEGMTPDALISALEKAGATFYDEADTQPKAPITKADFMALGLTGPGSVEKRVHLLAALRLPSKMTVNALLEFVNLTMELGQLEQLMK